MRLLPASPPPLPMDPARRRRALWLWGGVAVVLLVVLAVIDERLKEGGAPGIVPFEVAFTSERASEILGEWGSDGRDFALVSLLVDYVYLVAWALTLALLCLAVAARQWREGWASFGERIAWAPLLGGVCDALEDTALLAVLGSDGDDPWPLVAGVFATAKFALIGVTVAYLIAGLIAARGRPAPDPAQGS
jgi:hypothetical protein